METVEGVFIRLPSSLPEEFEEVTLDLGENENVEEEIGEGENLFFLALLLWNLANFSVHFFLLTMGIEYWASLALLFGWEFSTRYHYIVSSYQNCEKGKLYCL